MISFKVLLILILGLKSVVSESERTEKIGDLYLVFVTEPETIEYARVNITRSRRDDTRTLCCISLLGDEMICSRYDLFVEYTGKMSSKEVVIDCKFIGTIEYSVSRRFKPATIVSIIVGVFIVLFANGMLIYYVWKKTRSVPTLSVATASSANA